MSLLHKLNRYFEPKKDFGVIFLRVLIGWRLIDGTQDNVFSWERMLEFRDFLDQRGVAYPLVAAHVSVYAQFICGILFIFGAFMRPAAVVMIINFIVAILVAHLGTTFQQSFEVLTMLFSAVFFLFYGAGRISIDKWLQRRNKI
jgi:putative oxidoreductase